MENINLTRIARLIRDFLRTLEEKKFIVQDSISFFDEDEDETTEIFFKELLNTRTIEEYIQQPVDSESNKKNKKIFYVTPRFEEIIYRFIFYSTYSEPIFHYTNLSSLFSILNSRNLRLTSISGLNDRGEVTFAESLVKRRQIRVETAKILKLARRRFILSCSEIEDHLNSWRLYGDDGKGVCIGFKLDSLHQNKSNKFALGRIVYKSDLWDFFNELVADVLKYTGYKLSFRRLYLWKNFIKREDYNEEKEIRLLYYNSVNKKHRIENWGINRYNILNPYLEFPLIPKSKSELPITIKSIMFGPKANENKVNKHQFRAFLKSIKISGIKVKLSTKSHYR